LLATPADRGHDRAYYRESGHPVIKSLPLRTMGLHVVLHLPALSLRPNAEREQAGAVTT